jgi:hypothetical protein
VRRLTALVITIGLTWLVVSRFDTTGGSAALALGVALIAAVDRRLALRVRAAAADHRLPRVRPGLRDRRCSTSSTSRWPATCSGQRLRDHRDRAARRPAPELARLSSGCR